MTITASIASQSIGTGANAGSGLFPQRVTKQANTTQFSLHGQITNGLAGYNITNSVRVWFASSPFVITAAAAVTALRQAADYFDIRPHPDSSQVAVNASATLPIGGTYVYFWVDVPTVPVAQTLSVSLVELP